MPMLFTNQGNYAAYVYLSCFRKKQQDILWQHLVQINMPKYIANDIKNGILSLESEAPFVDHTPPTDVALAQADLGWGAFLRGRISVQWQHTYNNGVDNNHNSRRWAGSLVLYLLQYSQQLWTYRCGVIHRHDKEETRQRHREDLLQQIQVAYEEFNNDPFCVPSNWRSLFHRPLNTYCMSDRDTLACWLRSFSEAKQQQEMLLSRQKQQSNKFFAKFWRKTITPPRAESFELLCDDDSSVADTYSVASTDTSDSDLDTPFHVDDEVSWDGGETVSWDDDVCMDV